MTLASLKGSKQGGTRPKHMKLEGRSGKDFLAHELEEGVKLLLSVGNAGCALWEIVAQLLPRPPLLPPIQLR